MINESWYAATVTGSTWVESVTGPLRASDLGPTLVHEHVMIDMRQTYPVGPAQDPDAIPELRQLGLARRNFTEFPGVIVLNDPELAVAELRAAHRAGCRTIIDQTSIGLRLRAGHAEKLADISRRTAINIVAGAGYYVHKAHPPQVSTQDERQIADSIIEEITVGIDGTSIRAGVIGEIGMSQPIHPEEWKVLAGACLAQRETGVPLMIHPYYGGHSRVAPDVARFILDRGVDPAMVCMGHMDGHMDLGYQKSIAELGFFIGFDGFGLELYYEQDDFNHNTHDSLRIRHVLHLIEDGFLDNLLLSQDVATKLQLPMLGGWGYGHLFSNIEPMMLNQGLDPRDWHRLTVDNPGRLFTR